MAGWLAGWHRPPAGAATPRAARTWAASQRMRLHIGRAVSWRSCEALTEAELKRSGTAWRKQACGQAGKQAKLCLLPLWLYAVLHARHQHRHGPSQVPTYAQRAQQRVDDAVHVVQREAVQDAVGSLPGPRLAQRVHLRCKAGMRVQRACRQCKPTGRVKTVREEPALWMREPCEVEPACAQIEPCREPCTAIGQRSGGEQWRKRVCRKGT